MCHWICPLFPGTSRSPRLRRLATTVAVAAGLSMLAPFASAQTAPAYQFAPPAGWLRTDQNGTIMLKPSGEPPDSVLLALLPIVPRQPDFDRQFAELVLGLESGGALRNRRDVQTQRLGEGAIRQLVYFATYSSDRGDRFLAIMARAEGTSVGVVMFSTVNAETYYRLGQTATHLFDGLRIVAAAASQAMPAPQAPSAGPPRSNAGGSGPPAPAAGRTKGSYRGTGIVGVWTGTEIRRYYGTGTFTTTVALPAWYVFFDDGVMLQQFPDEGLAGFDRDALRANPKFTNEWQTYTFSGSTGSTVRPESAAPWALEMTGPEELKVNNSSFRRCPDVTGTRLEGSWYQQSVDDATDPDFVRRPRGRRPLIHFTGAGRFDDEGLFAVAIPSRTGGNDQPGAGTYEIRDYSIILHYDDGRVRQEAFPGLGPALALTSRAAPDARIFIRGVGLLKRPR
jgi:hypothetical protein